MNHPAGASAVRTAPVSSVALLGLETEIISEIFPEAYKGTSPDLPRSFAETTILSQHGSSDFFHAKAEPVLFSLNITPPFILGKSKV